MPQRGRLHTDASWWQAECAGGPGHGSATDSAGGPLQPEQLEARYAEFEQLAGVENCAKLRAFHAAVVAWQAARQADSATAGPVPAPILLDMTDADKVRLWSRSALLPAS